MKASRRQCDEEFKRMAVELSLILRLEKELKQAELDRIAEATRYTKKGDQHILQERRGIFQLMKVH